MQTVTALSCAASGNPYPESRMLKVKGDEVFWNGIPVRNLKLADMSSSDRFEFLCAISSHDPPVGCTGYVRARAPEGVSERQT